MPALIQALQDVNQDIRHAKVETLEKIEAPDTIRVIKDPREYKIIDNKNYVTHLLKNGEKMYSMSISKQELFL